MVKDAHTDVEETKLKVRDMLPPLKCVLSMYKVVGLIPNITQTGYGWRMTVIPALGRERHIILGDMV